MTCPLCLSERFELYDQDKKRSYLKCLSCNLIYVPRQSLLSLSEEKARYDAHENEEESPGYHQYLSKIADSIKPYLSNPSLGLDFGSGRTTLLARYLLPHEVHSYDVFYHPDEAPLKLTYDFIVLSEVIEHLRNPLETMNELKAKLKPHGQIFIKTKWYPEKKTDFASWFYKRDLTHIQFFDERSFDFFSQKLCLRKAQLIGEDLYLLSNDGI